VDNTDHILDVNQGNLPWEYDQVNIICPVFKPGSENTEQHVIYSVDKDEYDNCRVANPRPKIVAICNRPQSFMYFTITF
jgi:ephrin-B